jgi:hypothetical protein
MPNT